MLEDDLYEPVLVQSQSRSMTKKENASEDEAAGSGVKLAVVSFHGLGEKYEKSYYEEKTYGEVLACIEMHALSMCLQLQVRERAGRRGERLQKGGGDTWDGRLEDRRWRGRSPEHSRFITL